MHRFLARLRRDARGNALAIVGAALVPLAGMIGSGVDISRAYMAKTRLQSACDAAALAGRRVMQNDTLDANVTAEATRFFNFNFNQRLYNTATFTPVVTRPSMGTVRVTASTTIPTSIMRIFGFTTLPLNVTCDASLNFVNTDIMLVLDTTGSMANDINDVPTNATSAQKITALREAVMALYDELRPVQTQLESNGLRLRYGVVPYSSTVNVGALIRAANPSYLADSVSYESRVANYNTASTSTTSTTTDTSVETYASAISKNNCGKYGNNQSFNGFTPSAASGGGPAPAATWAKTFTNDKTAGVDWGWPGAPVTSGNARSCRRHVTTTTTTYASNYAFTNATYRPVTYDTSQFKLGNPVTIASNDAGTVATQGSYSRQQLATAGSGVGTTSVTWNGCIMERDTVSTITANSGYTIPSGALDLNIDMIPNSDASRWRPQWPEVTYARASIAALNSAQSAIGEPITNYSAWQFTACPAAAVRLQPWIRGQLQSYVEHLDPDGYTYHDIGMLWGARLLSAGGIFGDSPATYNGMPVNRHIIFMTDGMLNTNNAVYGAYGMEGMEHRIGGTSTSDLTARHRQRFQMICNAAKGMNISIWVVAFASTLDQSLIDCASNPSQASVSANRDQLIAKFREIGNNIGALRLTQ